MGPEETALRRDLAAPTFRVGAALKRWEFVQLRYPIVFFRIPKPADKIGPPHFLLRVDVTGYPGPLTAQLWDARNDRALEPALRPHGAAGLLTAFTEWAACLYHPVDRLAREHWPGQFAELAWCAGDDICSFLETVHGLVNDPAYLQSSAPAESAELPREPLEDGARRAA